MASRSGYTPMACAASLLIRVFSQWECGPCVAKASANRARNSHRFIWEPSIHSQSNRRLSARTACPSHEILICCMLSMAKASLDCAKGNWRTTPGFLFRHARAEVFSWLFLQDAVHGIADQAMPPEVEPPNAKLTPDFFTRLSRTRDGVSSDPFFRLIKSQRYSAANGPLA